MHTFIVVHSIGAPSRPTALNVRYIQEIDHIAEFIRNIPNQSSITTKEHAQLVMTNGTTFEVVETQADILDQISGTNSSPPQRDADAHPHDNSTLFTKGH